MLCAPRLRSLTGTLPQCGDCPLRYKMVETTGRTILRGVALENTLLDRCLHLPCFCGVRGVPRALEHSIPHRARDGNCWVRLVNACKGSARAVFQHSGPGQNAGDDRSLLQIPSSHLSLPWNSLSWFVYRLGQTHPVTMLSSDLSPANPAGKKRGEGLGTGIWRRISPVQRRDMVLSRLP